VRAPREHRGELINHADAERHSRNLQKRSAVYSIFHFHPLFDAGTGDFTAAPSAAGLPDGVPRFCFLSRRGRKFEYAFHAEIPR